MCGISYTFLSVIHVGSRAAFHRVYEQPIVNGKEPSATAKEKEIAARRADEVRNH